ncbi:MAG: type II toxin-antitoxin system VapC family toxin [Candidatus Micrarchaeales archaeon]|jgi:predicted nucleic acid-binding protein
MVCLDTNVVIDFMHGSAKVINVVKGYSAKEPIAITSITLYELFKSAREPQLQSVFDFVSSTNVYGLGDKEAIEASKMYKKVKGGGKLVGENDILIAGIIAANNEVLLTEDKDFERLLNKDNLAIV